MRGFIVITKLLRPRAARLTGVISALVLTAGLFSTPASADAGPIYIGLGDSYAAGMGGGPYLLAPEWVPATCQQTDAAYPTALGGGNMACSGATTTVVSEIVKTAANDPRTARALADASQITVTVGGNDIDAGAAAVHCAALASTPECRAALFNSIAVKLPQLPAKIKKMVAVIKDKAPQARIMLTGYPRLFTVNDFMTPGQKSMARTVNAAADLLNATIAVSALANRVGYLSVTQRFINHGIGSAQPWIVGFPPVCASSLTCAPDGQPGDVFHPTRAGHIEGYAASIRGALAR
jgi:lysophospholipase L1-like esterase